MGWLIFLCSSLFRVCGLMTWMSSADVTYYNCSVSTACVRLAIHTDRWHLLNMTAYPQMILAYPWTALALCFYCYNTGSSRAITSVLLRTNWENNLKWLSGNVLIYFGFSLSRPMMVPVDDKCGVYSSTRH